MLAVKYSFYSSAFALQVPKPPRLFYLAKVVDESAFILTDMGHIVRVQASV